MQNLENVIRCSFGPKESFVKPMKRCFWQRLIFKVGYTYFRFLKWSIFRFFSSKLFSNPFPHEIKKWFENGVTIAVKQRNELFDTLNCHSNLCLMSLHSPIRNPNVWFKTELCRRTFSWRIKYICTFKTIAQHR